LQGVVVGTITGNCRFYEISDNLLKLETQIALNGKKKSSLKRITGFQVTSWARKRHAVINKFISPFSLEILPTLFFLIPIAVLPKQPK
jgi:hypothetical protein